ncbi:S-formylglutathione hydrolase [Microdochium nivale]|nr:S-formylglutathione hydrolase [Microdochium nivale]
MLRYPRSDSVLFPTGLDCCSVDECPSVKFSSSPALLNIHREEPIPSCFMQQRVLRSVTSTLSTTCLLQSSPAATIRRRLFSAPRPRQQILQQQQQQQQLQHLSERPFLRSFTTSTTAAGNMSFETKATIASFGGKLLKLSHESSTTGTSMAVNLYLPPSVASSSAPGSSSNKKVPVLIYLSGLTCTPDNCSEKGFLQAHAAKHDLAIVYPDTSPRGTGIAGEDDAYDFGSGAGFYIDATAEPWSKNYRMESYVTKELPGALFASGAYGGVLDGQRVSITGHSMGGHGALTLFLKNPGMYRSVSAFAPICNPTAAPWGEKAFEGYFGRAAEAEWKSHDATELLKSYAGDKGKLDILIDVGTGDNFYKQKQLLPENLEAAAKEAGVAKGVTVRYQADYDHSYFFISTFGGDHVAHAAKYLA